MLVVDASVVVKAIVIESGSDKALRIVAEEPDLRVPAHCLAEVGETLARKIRMGQAVADQVEQSMPVLVDAISPVPLEGLLIDAMRLSSMSGASVYDCLYVVLARSLDCPFVTADIKLVAKMKETAHAPLMRALDSFTGSP